MSRKFPGVRAVFPTTLLLALTLANGTANAADFPITSSQRSTAQQVSQAGVPLSELAADAPDSYTVKKGDTLWDISKLFLKSPWRWPELWGMNLDQIRNPHLIYPGQVLFLDKSNGRARLSVGRPLQGNGQGGDGKLSPRIREELLDNSAIASVPMHLIGPFLNEAVVFDDDRLAVAPRIVATQEGRVLLSRGETAYVRGDVSAARTWQVFRSPKPLIDPGTGEVLGYEARHVGTAELKTVGSESEAAVVPSTFTVSQLREEANVGDRLAPLPPSEQDAFAPHPPGQNIAGRIISVYGDGLNAGQNQIVALNKGKRDGLERGHVLALWRSGTVRPDLTAPDRQLMTLPDERHGMLFVFRVFERVSYALILQVQAPVQGGDRFTQP
ncbi:LysM peptidoglycan-binding domain-containing protein [Ideonella margarita]|uniref:LysM domain-containing protein n=1 Tax=Ideonella margarita TaxID=2984191 RepID=A0ABU9BYP3_9BURK